MRPKLKLLVRILNFTGRDMLIGFILGFSFMILLHKINPRIHGIGLLAILGLIGGVLKGLSKALLLGKLDSIADEEYKKSYPKFKILGLWFFMLVVILIYSYGFNVADWFTDPLAILRDAEILKNVATGWWVVYIFLIFATGLACHYFEPPKTRFNKPPLTEKEADDKAIE